MRVALTFDTEHPDRPHRPGAADEILAFLAGEAVSATFFLEGRWARANPTTAARIAADGHLVGSHSFCHAHLPAFSPRGLRREIRDAEQAIREVTGADPRPWFRCPYGDGWDDPGVQGALEELGYRHVGWDVILGDWERERDAPALLAALADGLRRCDGEAVVLLHSWPQATVEALPAMVGSLRAQGAALVRVDQLARAPQAVVF